MEKLSYSLLERQGYEGYLLKEAPERILQFGQGNFLRAFVDDFVDLMNERAGFDAKVVVVQSGHDSRARFNGQDSLYTLFLRGRRSGEKISEKRIISSLSRVIHATLDFEEYLACAANPQLRFIVSNTTEAGIVYDPSCQKEDAPASSFPGKLTQLLYKRYCLGLKGFIILSCELIDRNGQELLRCVQAYADQWELPQEFKEWLVKDNIFCSTLVDRIVPGFPRAEAASLWEELGYEDDILDTGEIFASWVIEGPQEIKKELPFEEAGLPIRVVEDVTPYKHRKVRILNGAHSCFALAAYLGGHDIVRECMHDETILAFMHKALYDEVIPTITDLPREDLLRFAQAVSERFANPYIDHQLLSITLNSTEKWKARCAPSLLAYAKERGELPPCLTFSFAAYLKFYHAGAERGEGCLLGKRGEDLFQIQDDEWVLDFFYDHREDDNAALAKSVIGCEQMWGQDLMSLPGFEEKVVAYLDKIDQVGMLEALKEAAGE